MKVSFGKTIITPQNDGHGVPMAGYTRPFFAQGKLDDIFARGMLIEENTKESDPKRLLVISLDLLKVPLAISEYIKIKIQEQTNFGDNSEQILIHATHTHSAPDLTGEFYWPGSSLNVFRGIMFGANRNDRYIVFFTHRIITMVRQLILDLTPSKIAQATHLIEENIVINRRNPLRKSKIPLWLLVFKRIDNDQIFGILGNYGMHPTSLSNRNDKLSADYPGRFCYHIESETENKIRAIFITGAAGDLNPITTCGTDFETLENDPKARKTVYDQLGTYTHTKKLGYFLGNTALHVARAVNKDDYFDIIRIRGFTKAISITIEDKQPYVYKWGTWLTNKLVFYLKRLFLFPMALKHASGQGPNFPAMYLTYDSKKKKVKDRMKVNTLLQLLHLRLYKSINPSDVLKINLIGVPGEVFEDLAEKLIHIQPEMTSNNHIFQNSNDWVAYLFELKDYIGQGGYEPIASASPHCGQEILKKFKMFFNEIQVEIEKISFDI
ncbi:hypothetical protein [Candidatus Lokiarchaeum ossiferum]|uniref:hypothetical protein n=1 Tax=Candidatus Lokiarchaeum ossiferum TaxID=2951803 RepID=UPI00352C716C